MVTKNKQAKTEKNPKGAGRQTRLTQALVDEVCGYIREGRNYVNAYAKAGVYKKLVSVWLIRGEEDSKSGLCTLYAYAYDEITLAKAEANGNAEADVLKGVPNWQSRARYLEAHDRENWSQRQVVAGDKDHPVKVENTISVVSDKAKDLTAAIVAGQGTG